MSETNWCLAQWSMRTTHLLALESFETQSGSIVKEGILCGRKPNLQKRPKFGFNKEGERIDMLTMMPGNHHIRWGQWKFCMDCHRKAIEYHVETILALPGGAVNPSVTSVSPSDGQGALTA